MKIIYRLLFALTIILALVGRANAERYIITPEGQETLNEISRLDLYVKQLPDGVQGLSALHTILGKVLSGPVELILQWNQNSIAAWRKANTRLAQIAKAKTCDIITEYLDDDPVPADAPFFEQLSRARGCD